MAATPAADPPPPAAPSSPSPAPAAAPSSAPAALGASPFPFAAAPDIIRAHQKDAYFQGALANQLADLHRRLLGARSAHAWAAEARTAADLLYLSLTTLIGNRTLGEEYCDLVQVEAPPSSSSSSAGAAAAGGPVLPSLRRRSAYIASSVLVPYALARLLPSVRARLRARLEARLAALARAGRSPSLEFRAARYLLAHLGALTSGDHLRAAALAAFYFTGAYYSLAKRAARLRYVFTRRVEGGPGQPGGAAGRAGYEVLGVLLVAQLAVQGWLHLREALAAPAPGGPEEAAAARERAALAGRPVDVSLDDNSYSSNHELLLGGAGGGGGGGGAGTGRGRAAVGAMAHTPVARHDGGARYDLAAGGEVMAWIRGRAQRKCTLCLEELRDPAATQCGHVFCWSCIGDWVREKPECPLCRRAALVQHILPLRVV